jgi:molecular chaperone GrpE
MSEEHEIPVKVVDRRWWARGEDSEGPNPERTSLKPTYVEELERQVAEKEQQAQEFLGKYRQAAQEFENARARMRKEVAKDAERSRREILISLLEVVDNLDRAIESARRSGTPSSDPLLQGVDLVRQQFLGKLDGFGIRRIEPGATEKDRFDPSLHEAVSAVPAADPSEDGLVVGVVRPGYKIGDEVLRPALVAVAKAAETSEKK